ncbi:GntR family transcriptional regulator [Streptomyces sp. NPDC050619]|uniref:GntR family transcriptional regulator n=1 Tax=Streptomyces sp. NPDC050619 TaxID=3157214 RepID=UPI0034296480
MAPHSNNVALSSGINRELVDRVRALILTREIPSGSRLLPKDLQERFGVSVVPVREALRTLEAEGLIVTVPRKGTMVTQLTLSELENTYAMRRLIEPPLMVQATADRTPDDIESATSLHDELRALGGDDVERWLEVHRRFHESMLAPALNPVSRRVLGQLWLTSERYVRLGVTAFHVDEPAQHDHRALLDAFTAGDPESISTETVHHLDLVEALIKAHVGDQLK